MDLESRMRENWFEGNLDNCIIIAREYADEQAESVKQALSKLQLQYLEATELNSKLVNNNTNLKAELSQARTEERARIVEICDEIIFHEQADVLYPHKRKTKMSEQTTTPTETKYEAKFIRWMEIGNYHLVDGEYVELRKLSEEELKTLYDRFVDSTTGISLSNSAELIEPSETTLHKKLEAELQKHRDDLTTKGTIVESILQKEIDDLKAENKKLQKDVDDFAKAYAKQVQLLVDVSDKVKTIIGIEPIEFVKKELVELKEVLLKHMEESAK